MSLDVYLNGPEREVEKICPCCDRSYIEKEREELFSANITHNLNSMAEAAGIYYHLWRPNEIGIEKADQLIEPLSNGLDTLVANRKMLEGYNPPNGWGTYNALVDFVRRYLAACREYPNATVYACR